MLILFFIIPVIALVYYYYKSTVPVITGRQRTLLRILRFVTIIILLMLLFNPVISFNRNHRYYPDIVFLTDNSLSMDLSVGKETKAKVMDNYSNQLIHVIEDSNFNTHHFTFADGIDGERTGSNISLTLENLTERLSLDNIEKVFLLSDGWFSDEEMDIVNRFNIPITTIHPDYELEDFDLGINRLLYNQIAYTEEEVTIIAEVFADNYTDKGLVSLFLEDELIDTQEVDFSEESFRQVTFDYTFDDPGLYSMYVEIEATDYDQEESNLNNNVYPGAIRVIDKRSGISILTDRLNWDVRYINNALSRDDRKEISLFTFHNNRFYEANQSIQFHDIFQDHMQLLVIVNHGDLDFDDDQLQLIDRFVGNGGGLLFVGKPKESLQEIKASTDMGIDRSFRSTISLSSSSDKYQTFNNINADNIPTVNYYYVSTMLHPEILAAFNNEERSPAIIYNQYRQGRVIYMPFFDLWRWQMRAEDDQYNTFMANLSTWLANPAGADFFAQTDKNSYFLGEKVTIKLTALDETLSANPNLNPRLQLFDKDDSLVEEEYMSFANQNYLTAITNLSSGQYTYRIVEETIDKTAEGDFLVSDVHSQGRYRGYNYPLLSFISRQTGGEIIHHEDIDSFTTDAATQKTERVKFEISLYRHWLIITLFLLSFCLEIFFRKKWGLL